MPIKPLSLILPMPSNIANGAHGHYYGRHRAKLAYWESLDVISHWCGRPGKWKVIDVEFDIPAPPPTPFAKASIRSRMYLGNAMDDSNAMRRHKWIEDWLKTRGYIVDDRKKCLTWEGFPEQVISRKQTYRCEITLTPIAA